MAQIAPDWVRRRTAVIVYCLLALASSAGIAWNYHIADELHQHTKRQVLEHCTDDNEFRAGVVAVLHRWAELGIPPEEHAAQVAQFLAEVDAMFAPLPCPPP